MWNNQFNIPSQGGVSITLRKLLSQMESTVTRKSNVKQIEARLRNAIQLHSGVKIAEVVGLSSAQITRWQYENGVIEKMARLLDFIGYDSPNQDLVITNISGDEIRKLIDMLEHLRLPKKEPPRRQPMRLSVL